MRTVPHLRRRLLPAAFTATVLAVGIAVGLSPTATPVAHADAGPARATRVAVASTTVVARQPQWAVAAVPFYWSLTVRESGTGAVVGESTPGSGWVAVDFNPGARQRGEYLLETSMEMGDAETRFLDGSAALRNSSTTSVGWEKQDWPVDLRHIALRAGERLRLTVRGGGVGSISIVHTGTGPADLRTRNWATADANFAFGKPEADDVNTAWFTAPATADYGVIFMRGTFGDTAQVHTTVLGA